MNWSNGARACVAAASLACWAMLGCCLSGGDRDEEIPATKGPLALGQVRWWAYQIQGVGESGAVDDLAASHYDLLVLEPTRTDWSSEDREFDTKGMVARLKATAGGDGEHRKRVIAYINIGEAEDWRWYWTWSRTWKQGDPRPADWPNYILTHDPDGWGGNYPVAYWDPRWKDVVIHGKNQDSAPYGDYTSMLDEVIKDGFDGVYLDWVEGYEHEAVVAEANQAGVDPAVEMINFISEIRAYGRQRDPNFIVIQQNAAALLDGHPGLLNVIDAIAQEEVWYAGDATDNWYDPDGYDQRNDQELTDYYIGYLDQYLAAGVPVFNCEYARYKASKAYSLSSAKGYVAYCTRTSLAALTTTPPPGY